MLGSEERQEENDVLNRTPTQFEEVAKVNKQSKQKLGGGHGFEVCQGGWWETEHTAVGGVLNTKSEVICEPPFSCLIFNRGMSDDC